MNRECRHEVNDLYRTHLVRLATLRRLLATHTLEQKKEAARPADRDALLAGYDPSLDADASAQDQRQRLLTGTHRLNDASKRLENSHRVALETEEIGAQTLAQLRQQREQITHANATLDEANSFMDRNMRILKDMSRRWI